MIRVWEERQRADAAVDQWENREAVSARLAAVTKYGRCPVHKQARVPVAHQSGPSAGWVTLRCPRWFHREGHARMLAQCSLQRPLGAAAAKCAVCCELCSERRKVAAAATWQPRRVGKKKMCGVCSSMSDCCLRAHLFLRRELRPECWHVFYGLGLSRPQHRPAACAAKRATPCARVLYRALLSTDVSVKLRPACRNRQVASPGGLSLFFSYG